MCRQVPRLPKKRRPLVTGPSHTNFQRTHLRPPACSDNVEDALAKLQEILDAAWKSVQPIEEDPEKAKEIKKQVRCAVLRCAACALVCAMLWAHQNLKHGVMWVRHGLPGPRSCTATPSQPCCCTPLHFVRSWSVATRSGCWPRSSSRTRRRSGGPRLTGDTLTHHCCWARSAAGDLEPSYPSVPINLSFPLAPFH